MHVRLLFTGVFMLITVLELWAQPAFKKTRYTKEQGLSHNTVLGMSMDDRGFLWLATMDGLNRFDGLEMKVYRPNEADSLAITDGFIHGIHQHENGNLWISTRDGGLNIFDPKTETFKSFNQTNSKENNFPARQISLLHKDRGSNYWVSFFGHSMGLLESGSNRYHPANIVDIDTQKKRKSTNSLIEFNDGSMLVSSFNGLYYLPEKEIRKFKEDPTSEEILEAYPIPFSKATPFPNSRNMKIDSNGDLWVNVVTSGLEKMNKQYIPDFLKKSIESGVASNSSSNGVVERDGYLISGHLKNELLLVNLSTGEQSFSKLDPSVKLESATYLFEDPNGELWVHTWGAGVYKLEQKQGIEIVNSTTNPGIWESDFILGFEEDENGFWIGTGAEVAFYDLNNGNIYALNERLANTKVEGVWSFERDDLGLWIVTVDKGLVFISSREFEKKTRMNAKRFTYTNSIIKSKNLRQVFRDSRGWLWLGYEGDEIQIVTNPAELINDKIADVMELSSEGGGEAITISSENVRKFYEDRDGYIWVATTDAGFDKITVKDEELISIQSFQNIKGDVNSIPHNDARSVYQQNDSTYWFATYGGGIAKWNSKKDEYTRYNTSNGLPNNSTYSIIAGNNDQYVWVSTNSGLAQLDTKAEMFDVLTEEDGAQNNEFNTGAYLSLADGRLLFGGINGFNIISPEKLEKNERIPPVYMTEINLFDEPLQMDTSATEKKKLKLSHNQNFLSFTLSALDFENPKQNQFAYMMEGVDQEWVYSGNRNYASYPNLQPGAYIFKVKASNNDGVWNETGKSLDIIITPPWWQTIWFRLLSGFLFFAMVIFTVRYISQRRLREQIRKMELESKLRNERERISRDLHDHVGAQLANIMSGLSLADKYNQVDNKEKSSSLMNSLRGDAEVTIKQLRETIWALNQNSLSLIAFKDHLQSYFKNQTAFSETLELIYDVEEEKPTILSSTQALNIFRVIQEASQNTLKYAEANCLAIKLHRRNGHLFVQIKDDGNFKGDKSSFNGGYGFGNMKKRTTELGGKISIDTENGTEVNITIPL